MSSPSINVADSTGALTTTKKPRRANGKATYKKLLDTLEAELPKTDAPTISLKELAGIADVPVASAYHFFSNPDGAVTALAERYLFQFVEALDDRADTIEYKSLRELFADKSRLARKVYERAPAALKIYYGPSQGLAVRQIVLKSQRISASQVLLSANRRFVLPQRPDLLEKCVLGVIASDALWTASYILHGRITDEMAEEARRVGFEYFAAFVGAEHSVRAFEEGLKLFPKNEIAEQEFQALTRA